MKVRENKSIIIYQSQNRRGQVDKPYGFDKSYRVTSGDTKQLEEAVEWDNCLVKYRDDYRKASNYIQADKSLWNRRSASEIANLLNEEFKNLRISSAKIGKLLVRIEELNVWSVIRERKINFSGEELKYNNEALIDLYDSSKLISKTYRELGILRWLYEDMSTSDHDLKYATEAQVA